MFGWLKNVSVVTREPSFVISAMAVYVSTSSDIGRRLLVSRSSALPPMFVATYCMGHSYFLLISCKCPQKNGPKFEATNGSLICVGN